MHGSQWIYWMQHGKVWIALLQKLHQVLLFLDAVKGIMIRVISLSKSCRLAQRADLLRSGIASGEQKQRRWGFITLLKTLFITGNLRTTRPKLEC